MRSTFLPSLGLVLIMAACGQGSVATDAPPEPSPSSELVTFTSDRYGYSIRHPADWVVLEQPGVFRLTALRPRHPGSDTIGTPDSHKFDGHSGIVVIGARPLDEGETLEDFTEAASAATRCGPHGQDTASLAGEPAELRKFECGGTRWHQLTALHADRAYLVWVTRPLTTAFLETFAFSD